jgi:hypothetical protein
MLTGEMGMSPQNRKLVSRAHFLLWAIGDFQGVFSKSFSLGFGKVIRLRSRGGRNPASLGLFWVAKRAMLQRFHQ